MNTIITMTHPKFGVKILYVPDVKFSTHLNLILRDAWANGHTITIHSKI